MAGKKSSAKAASAKGARKVHRSKAAKAAKAKGKSGREAAVEAYIGASQSLRDFLSGAGWR
jgi:hypothetical protein